jgi:hypothetical protein
LAIAMTMIVASDSMTPLTRLVVTASSGHRPRICIRLVFCCQTPLSHDLAEFFAGDHWLSCSLSYCGREELLAVLGDVLQRLVHRLDHGARRHRRAGDRVEAAAVLPDPPFAHRRRVASDRPSNCLIHGRSLFLSLRGSM